MAVRGLETVSTASNEIISGLEGFTVVKKSGMVYPEQASSSSQFQQPVTAEMPQFSPVHSM